MKQEILAGMVLCVIGLSLLIIPLARWWTATEKWKTQDGTMPSGRYAILLRILGTVFALAGGALVVYGIL